MTVEQIIGTIGQTNLTVKIATNTKVFDKDYLTWLGEYDIQDKWSAVANVNVRQLNCKIEMSKSIVKEWKVEDEYTLVFII